MAQHEAGAFSELGLSGTEARILKSLIADGPATGSAIAARLGMQKSVAYFTLGQLAQKGFAYFVVINEKREYRPLEASAMRAAIENRRKEFSKNFEQMTGILEAVKKARKQAEFRIFQDWAGIRKAFEEVMDMKETGGEGGIVFTVYAPEKILPRLRRLMWHVHSGRVKKRIPCRLLVSQKLRPTIGADRKRERFTEVRFVSSEYAMPMNVNVYEDRTLLAVWTSPPLAIVITSREVSDSFRAFFDMLWEIGKP